MERETSACRHLSVISSMNVRLVSKIPSQDGYFLMKCNQQGGLHLVLIQTNLDGSRVLIPDNYFKLKNQIMIGINEAHAEIFREALFSESPLVIIN
jgi:hypothetical protein